MEKTKGSIPMTQPSDSAMALATELWREGFTDLDGHEENTISDAKKSIEEAATIIDKHRPPLPKDLGAVAAAREIDRVQYEWFLTSLVNEDMPEPDERVPMLTAIITRHKTLAERAAEKLLEMLKKSTEMLEAITVRYYAPTKAESSDVLLRSKDIISQAEPKEKTEGES